MKFRKTALVFASDTAYRAACSVLFLFGDTDENLVYANKNVCMLDKDV